MSRATSNYYTGCADEQIYAALDGRTMVLSASAGDPVIAELIEALKGLIKGTSDANTALDKVQSAASDVADLRAGL